MNTKRAPKVRFKGFTDAWEQRKLGEMASKTYGGGTPTTSNDEFWNGTIPWIQSSDLIEHQVFGVHPRKYITKLAVMNSATKIVPENALAIITRVGVGKLAVMPFSYTTSQDFLSLSELKTDVKFTAYLLYKKLQCELIFVQGTSIKGITKDELLSKIVFVPERKEQEAIGAFFANLDRLITLHQRKLDKTKKLKKAFLNLIFGQKLRFRGFTDSWELRKLEEISNKVIEKNKDCKYTETFTNSAELGIISQRDFFDKDISNNENMNGYYVVRNGDFVYNPRVSTSAPVGPIKRNNLGRTGIMSPLYYIFHTHDIVDGRYLEYYFSSTKWHKFMKQNGDSGVRSDRLAIKDTTFIKMIIPIPSKMKEQRKVGIFFKLLDDTTVSYTHLTLPTNSLV